MFGKDLAIVLPLFKSKSRYDSANYRPRSLTSVCCKAMERILTAELMHYLEANNILSETGSLVSEKADLQKIRYI